MNSTSEMPGRCARMRPAVRVLAGLSVLLAAGATQAGKPVGLMTVGRRGASVAEAKAIGAFLLDVSNVEYEIKPWFEPKDFGQYAAVVIPTVRGEPARPWTDPEIAAAVDFAKGGGVLVFVGGGPMIVAGKGRDLKRLAPLVGCSALGKHKNAKAKLLDAADPLLKGIEPMDYAWARYDNLFAKLSAAKPIVGLETQRGPMALVTVHRVGQGRVYLFAREYFRLLSAQTPGHEAYGEIMKRAIMSAGPATHPPPKERWTQVPLWRK